MARMPPALVLTLPPRLADSSPGYTGYTSPSAAVRSSSSVSVTPGWTTATWFSVSISSTLFMRSNDTTMPSWRGLAAPDRPVPLPRAVTGVPVSVASARTAATCSAVSGRTTWAGVFGSADSVSSWV
jgi:hypothetical protein